MVLFLLIIQLTFISILCSSKIYFTFQVIFFGYFFIHVQQDFSSKFSFFFTYLSFCSFFLYSWHIVFLLPFLISNRIYTLFFFSFIKWFNLLLVFYCLPSIFWIYIFFSVVFLLGFLQFLIHYLLSLFSHCFHSFLIYLFSFHALTWFTFT